MREIIRQQPLHRLQRLLAAIAGDGHHLLRVRSWGAWHSTGNSRCTVSPAPRRVHPCSGSVMGGLAQHRQQPLHRLQRLLAAIVAGDGHHLLRGQVMGGLHSTGNSRCTVSSACLPPLLLAMATTCSGVRFQGGTRQCIAPCHALPPLRSRPPRFAILRSWPVSNCNGGPLNSPATVSKASRARAPDHCLPTPTIASCVASGNAAIMS